MISVITGFVSKVVRTVKAPLAGKKSRKCCKKCRC